MALLWMIQRWAAVAIPAFLRVRRAAALAKISAMIPMVNRCNAQATARPPSSAPARLPVAPTFALQMARGF